MSQTTNEMAINLPITSVGMDAPINDISVSADAPEIDDSIVIGAPDHHIPLEYISVYASEVRPVSNTFTNAADQAPSLVATFDVIFSVGVHDADGKSSTYQVVKRIGVDKQKLAAEAMRSTPVSIIENKNSKPKGLTTKQFRVLAGLE